MLVFQIHGEADRIFPASLTRPNVIVPGGEHALSLFSPTAVNEVLASVLEQLACRTPSSRSRFAGDGETG